MEVSLFLDLCIARFFPRSILIPLTSQKKNILASKTSSIPYKLFAKSVRPRINPVRMMKNMSSISE